MSSNRRDYRIESFDLPIGWKIRRNVFTTIDPKDDFPMEVKDAEIFDQEDMLLVQNGEYILDLGWYGDKAEGSFCIHFIKGHWLTGCLLEKFRSRNQQEIKHRIEDIMNSFELNDFADIQGYCVNDNDPNCLRDFSFVDQYEPRLEDLKNR